MLFLVGGKPGGGKTLWTISHIQKEFADRPVYYHHIEILDEDRLPWQHLDDPHAWNDLPSGSVIVIDEAHRFFPQRKAGIAPPSWIEAFAEHRHSGYDIFLITQEPMNLDVFIRRVANHYVFLDRLFGHEYSRVFWFNEYVADYADRQKQKHHLDRKQKFRFPKKLYGAYKSAEAHTVKKRFPFKLLLLPLLVLAVLWLFWLAYDGLMGSDDESVEAAQAATVGLGGWNGPVAGQSPARREAVNEDYLASMRPVVQGAPWTAPRYRDVMEPETFPRPYCIAWQERAARRCKCHSQQGTTMFVASDLCYHIAEHGFFDPTIATDQIHAEGERAAKRSAAAAPASSVVVGSSSPVSGAAATTLPYSLERLRNQKLDAQRSSGG